MFTATEAEIVDTDQPNSACSGSISTPGTARNATAPTSARKVTAATHQAGWMRWIVGAPVRETAVLVTVRACRTVQRTNEWPDGQHVQGSGHDARGGSPDHAARGRGARAARPDGLRAGPGRHVPRRCRGRRRAPALPRAGSHPRWRPGPDLR